MSDRATFLSTIQRALGKLEGRPVPVAPSPESGLSVAPANLIREAALVRDAMGRDAGPLLDALAETARKGSWVVTRAGTHEDAADAVADICRRTGISTALRSTEDIFERVPVDRTLASAGVSLKVMARLQGGAEDAMGSARAELRQAAFTVEAGITGGDYAIAETGTLVVHPRRGLSRLISLAPPRHIAIIERGRVLPSLDELFILERETLLRGELPSSMNLISGPSRTGDIEATIVHGIHGPLEAYLVLVG